MVFSSPFFIFVFLPIVLLIIGIAKKEFHNPILLLASLFFYSWGSVSQMFILLFSIVLNYIFGLLLGSNKHKKVILSVAVICNLALLGYFKYFIFLVDNFNSILNSINYAPVSVKNITLPIGISFFTFQAISYLIDVYRKQTEVQRNFVNLAMYIALFPQLIAGPIVRYNSIVEQIKTRSITLTNISSGIHRFIFGLAKKVIIANAMASVADSIFILPHKDYGFGVAWLGIIAYTFQIYFDFSGYSDMAIGLGKIFGFNFPENFNYPYFSKSIKEFWRRWHISLSAWFRDYLYIPLGGNRLGKTRTYINLLIVFFCTGLWHGASWSFVFWGLLHGFFLLLERTGLDALLNRIWKPLRVFYTLLVVMIAWVFFRIEDFNTALHFTQKMFSFSDINKTVILGEYLNRKNTFILAFAAIYSFRGFRIIQEYLALLFSRYSMIDTYIILKDSIKFVLCIVLLLVTILYLSANTYNPFIYFRF